MERNSAQQWAEQDDERIAFVPVVPVAVQVSGCAIFALRGLGLFLFWHEQRLYGISAFVSHCAQSWNTTLILLGFLLLLYGECRCAIALWQGENWGRWGYLVCQLIACGWVLGASCGWLGTDLFALPGATDGWLLYRQFLLDKIPDGVVLLLLFALGSSRRYFNAVS